ncbi:helix-turn-helix domain-containing protein [Salipiger bermudensis]|uniref:helix-turn-helix domain-containing protein n=1 Tax=Salipiger bermudensis TaxID=344736 RepID=UPI001CD31A85|nr:helix-turn-helix domain-containing protein [Salipiger bermudensis]MCA0964971.1 helix-turn-helix domain-containing protein [Salipiger bermudensis]
MEKLPDTKKRQGNWVQTERAAHEAWAALIADSPLAARVAHVLTARLGDHNAVVISQKALAKILGKSDRSVRTALKKLEAENWIEIRQIGQNGTVNAYVVNDRIAWSGKRDGIRYSLFSANVIVTDEEQPDRNELGQQEPLRRLPSLYQDERQLPSGAGLPPISQPFFDGMEPDLPGTSRDNDPDFNHDE